MPINIVGTAPDQVPLNQHLGDLAYQSKDAVRVNRLTISSDPVQTGTTTVGTILIARNESANTSYAAIQVNGSPTGVSNHAIEIRSYAWGTAGDLSGAGQVIVAHDNPSVKHLFLSSQSGAVIFQAGSLSGERMRINSDGNVGILNTAPRAALHVGALNHTAGDAQSYTRLIIKQGTDNNYGGLYIERSGERKGYYMWMDPSTGSGDGLSFSRNNGGTIDTVMNLDRDGKALFPGSAGFGIGTGSPRGKFEIRIDSSNAWNYRSITNTGVANLGTHKGYLLLAKAYTGGLQSNSWVMGTFYFNRGGTGSGNRGDIFEVYSKRSYAAHGLYVRAVSAGSYFIERTVLCTYGGVVYHAIETTTSGGDPDNGITFSGLYEDAGMIYVDATAVSSISAFGGYELFYHENANLTRTYYTPDDTPVAFNGAGNTTGIRIGVNSNYYWHIYRENVANGYLSFDNYNAAGSPTPRLRVYTNGRVVIGVTSENGGSLQIGSAFSNTVSDSFGTIITGRNSGTAYAGIRQNADSAGYFKGLSVDLYGNHGWHQVMNMLPQYQDSNNDGIIDITQLRANDGWRALEIFGSINPNSQGSGGYADVIHAFIYKGTGWNGSALTDYIYIVHANPPARDAYPSGGGSGNIINATWFNGSTESDSCAAGSVSHYVRLTAAGAVNLPYGSSFVVNVTQRY